MSNEIEFKGNVYKIGLQYFCFDSGSSRSATIDELVGIQKDSNESFPFKTESGRWGGILAIDPLSLGTITKAEVKPKDGEWWLCKGNNTGLERVLACVNGKLKTSPGYRDDLTSGYTPIHKMGAVKNDE